MKISLANLPRRVLASAFTLVEMLVVMLLLSVIVLGLMAMFQETQRAFRSSVNQTDVLEGGRMVSDMLARELAGMVPSHGNDVTNFYAEIPLSPAVWLEMPGGTTLRTNAMENFFFLSRENQKWMAYGYYFTNVAGGAGTLFRYYFETNLYADPRALWSQFIRRTNLTLLENTNFSRVIDGVVQFRIRAYDTNGVWLFTNSLPNNGDILNNSMKTDIQMSSVIPGEVGRYVFKSNAVPAYVEFELGILEKRIYQRLKAIPNYADRTNFLARQVGAVHVFRQRVPIRAVDISAYQ